MAGVTHPLASARFQASSASSYVVFGVVEM